MNRLTFFDGLAQKVARGFGGLFGTRLYETGSTGTLLRSIPAKKICFRGGGCLGRTMRVLCVLARDGEGCFRYALLRDWHPGHAQRAARYRGLTCTRGYAPACGKWSQEPETAATRLRDAAPPSLEAGMHPQAGRMSNLRG
jgi:hypothetical protein